MKGNASLRRALCFIPLGALLAASVACSLGGAPAASTSAPPTVVSEKPTPTERSLQRPTATQGEAAPGQAPSVGRLELASEVYDHPSGAFEMTPPAGWDLNEGKSLATWTAPDESGQVEIYVNTTGYALDADAVAKFIQANEENYLQRFDNYKVIDRGTTEDGSIAVRQSVTKDGNPWFVTSYYYQSKDAIYEGEFWVQQVAADAYQPTYQKIWDDLKVSDKNLSGKIIPYATRYTFTDPQGLFEFEIPYGWLYTYDSGTYDEVDKWTTPDGHAFVDSYKYDDGGVVTKTLAGQAALGMLHKYYAADVKITDDSVQSDGSERLIWYSPSGGYQGVSFFETRGTTFLMLSFAADNAYYDTYSPIFDDLLGTYKVP